MKLIIYQRLKINLKKCLQTKNNYNLLYNPIDVKEFDAEAIARKAMGIAAEICVYTNTNLTIESIDTGV